MLLSACLIVKDEERFLPSCLRSLSDVCEQLVVVDTGSTDRTVEIARDFGAEVHSFPWCGDFAAARNESLAHARGDFVLCIDADEVLHPEDAVPLRRTLEAGDHDVLVVSVESVLRAGAGSNVGRYPRVFRRYPDARFEFAIHEQIWWSLVPHSPRVLDSNLRIVHSGYDQEEFVLRAKRERNLEACRRVVDGDPDNAFFLFHWGLGHLQLGRPAEALPVLERALACSKAPKERANILAAIGQGRCDLGEPAAASKPLHASLEAAPSQYWSWAVLAESCLALGQFAHAAEAIERCLGVETSQLHTDFRPPLATLWMKLGLARLVCGRPQAAADALERGVQLGLPPALVGQVVAAAESFLARSAGRG